ncbi:hypothetical protein [Thalassotalea crassostreae]|uniref:hypothetical protein n=1 Tax=Thalassotalea crassostreae TaxID=1763536 RepID=UPI00083834A2|nr:hypothetical protein [Thalassotalea crassostreae]
MNKLAIFAAGLLLFFGAMLWFLASADWNGFIRTQIEIQGSKVTSRTVKVEKVDMKLSEGFGGIYGLSISNPVKYEHINAMYLGEVSLGIDIQSLSSSPIVIKSIKSIKPQVFVEFDKDGNNNISDILAAIKANTQSDNVQPIEPPKKKKKESKPETKIAIHEFVLSGVALTLDLTKVNGKTLDLELPTVALDSLGGAEGIEASKLGATIAKEILSEISKQAKEQYQAALKDKAKQKLDEKKKKLLDKLKG